MRLALSLSLSETPRTFSLSLYLSRSLLSHSRESSTSESFPLLCSLLLFPVIAMSGVSNKIVKTDPLTAHNYLYWRSVQVTMLKVLDVYDHVDSGQPDVAVIPPTDPAALVEWRKKDDLALAQIKLNISKSESYNTGDRDSVKTAYEVWLALHHVYTNTSMSSKMALQSRVQQYTFTGTSSVQGHSNGLRELADQLSACGEPVSEANLCMRLLLSMSTEYADVVNMFKWTASSSLQYSTILQSLIAKETEIKAQQTDVERTAEIVRAYLASMGAANTTALMAKRFHRAQLRCTYEGCGRTGHTIDECWTLHPELRRTRLHGATGPDPQQQTAATIHHIRR